MPATFQRLMEFVLTGLVVKCCLVYLDDILVVGSTLDEHRENLHKALSRLCQTGLRLKPTKCSFLQEQLEYSGYIVSGAGISTDPSKMKAASQFPVPTDLISLRSFLGLVSYYQRFMPKFSVVAHPLYALTHKDVHFE